MVDLFQHLLATYGYLVVALIIMVEGMGIPLPGETILLLGAAYAGSGRLDIRGVILVAALGAIVGDNLGYLIGRRGGRALLSRYGHVFRLDGSHLARAEDFYVRHGAKTVFFARFVAVLRTLSSLLAGANRMPYRRFVLWNAAGGTVWAVVIGSLGAAFGSQWPRIAHRIGRIGLFLALAVAALLLGRLLYRRIAAGGGFTPFLRARFSPEGYFGLEMTTGVLLTLLAGAAFFGVADLVRDSPIPGLDLRFARFATGPGPAAGALTTLMRAATFAGKPWVLIVLSFGIALFLFLEDRWSDAFLAGLAVGGAETLNVVLKLVFARHRPGLADLATWSFPSGHATGSIAFFGLLAYFVLRAGGPPGRRVLAVAGAALAVLLIGASRVYLGEHYPTDVLGGWAVGFTWLASAVTAVETWRRRREILRERDAGAADRLEA